MSKSCHLAARREVGQRGLARPGSWLRACSSLWRVGVFLRRSFFAPTRVPRERRPGAEFLAWSAVHGLAMLVIDGPLASVIGPQMERVGQRLLDMVEKGL